MPTENTHHAPRTLHLTLGLLAVAAGLWCKAQLEGSSENLVYWPGAYILSLWILAMVFSQLIIHHRIAHLISGAVTFSFSFIILSSALLMILERFFRLEEHYTISNYWICIRDQGSLFFDGIFWFGILEGAKWLTRTRYKLSEQLVRQLKLEEALNQSDLRILRQEINPHFLFNAMNGIAMKVRLGEGKTAVSMIAALNDLLRLSLRKTGEKKISLQDELELLERYLLIEKIRFEDQVEVVINISASLFGLKVPELILQPLVENAFKHGIRQAEKTRIDISANLEEHQLVLLVHNSHLEAHHFNFASNQGTGLTNIASRLRKLYGTAFRFQSIATTDGIAFKITLPAET